LIFVKKWVYALLIFSTLKPIKSMASSARPHPQNSQYWKLMVYRKKLAEQTLDSAPDAFGENGFF